MILGIDTSCYTTSIAVISESGSILLDKRSLLQVKLGEIGLQQSAAIFQHLNNLPQLFDDGLVSSIQAIVATVKPRPVVDSYLPVFRAGSAFGEAAAHMLKVPFLTTSHQEGHIRAALYDNSNSCNDEPLLVWHLSGGTTELLLVKPALENNGAGYHIEKIGGSSDLHVGQFIDRVGVSIGLSFPAGPALEKLAWESNTTHSLPVAVNGLSLSFSGPAAAAERAVKDGIDNLVIARQVFNCISKTLFKVTGLAVQQYKLNRVLLVGGVASNQIIRDFLIFEGGKKDIYYEFGPKELSSDNAVGVGLIGYDYFIRGSRL